MPKPKQPKNNPAVPTLKDFLESYDAVALRAALNTFESSEGWQLLQAYCAVMQRGYEVEALDKLTRKDELQAAAYASGYAKCAEDMANNFVPKLQELIAGHSSLVEDPRPEE